MIGGMVLDLSSLGNLVSSALELSCVFFRLENCFRDPLFGNVRLVCSYEKLKLVIFRLGICLENSRLEPLDWDPRLADFF